MVVVRLKSSLSTQQLKEKILGVGQIKTAKGEGLSQVSYAKNRAESVFVIVCLFSYSPFSLAHFTQLSCLMT